VALSKMLLEKEILGSHDLIGLLGERPYGNYPIRLPSAETRNQDVDSLHEAEEEVEKETDQIQIKSAGRTAV